MNHLYYGDNLAVLRAHIPSESVDLIYLDPPFNSNASYNVLFKGPKGDESPAQIEAFDDTWTWNDLTSGQALTEVKQSAYQDAAAMLDAMVGFLGKNAMTAYLCMMGVRLIKLHRVLKPTGSLYLHCDPTASHYLKILLDAVFGARCFCNEIIWKRTTAHSSSKRYAPIHDTIFYYGKIDKRTWNEPRAGYEDAYLDRYYKYDDGDGRLHWRADITGAGIRGGESGNAWRGRNPTAIKRHWALPEQIIENLMGAEKAASMSIQEKLDALDSDNRIY